MQYERPTFTLPTVTRPMTQTEYEIRVGLRCAACSQLLTAKHICKKEK